MRRQGGTGADCAARAAGAVVRWLGHVSFSVYLLHGIVLLSGLTLLQHAGWPIAQWSDGSYIACCAGFSVLVLMVSSGTYLWIERRFMKSGVSKPTLIPAVA